MSGSWTVYAWYGAKPPAGASITGYPKADLLAGVGTAAWHTFAMEWKEHVGWLAPLLITAIAFVVVRHRELVVENPAVRRTLTNLFSLAFAAALVASVLGALVNNVAPNEFLSH